jgi:hypothetical protein
MIDRIKTLIVAGTALFLIGAAQPTQIDRRGTAASPLVVKVISTPVADKQAAEIANAANSQASDSHILMAITGVLALLAVGQWGAMLWQGLHIKRTADAAITGDQPYLFPTYPDMDMFFGETKPDRRYDKSTRTVPRIGFKFGNYGKTLAVLKEFKIEVALDAMPEAPSFTYASPRKGDIIIRPDTQTETQYIEAGRTLTPGEVDLIAVGTQPVFAFGYVKYIDIYGLLHTKGFGFKIKLGADKLIQLHGGQTFNYRKRQKAQPEFAT